MKKALRLVGATLGPLAATEVYSQFTGSAQTGLIATGGAVLAAVLVTLLADFVLLDLPRRWRPIRGRLEPLTKLEGDWQVITKHSERPLAYLRIFFDKTAGGFRLEGHAFSADRRHVASWTSALLELDPSRLVLHCPYHASFLETGHQVEGLAVIDFFATENDLILAGDGFFFDGDESGRWIAQSLRRLPPWAAVSSPEEAIRHLFDLPVKGPRLAPA